jgi:hypothetical protein
MVGDHVAVILLPAEFRWYSAVSSLRHLRFEILEGECSVGCLQAQVNMRVLPSRVRDRVRWWADFFGRSSSLKLVSPVCFNMPDAPSSLAHVSVRITFPVCSQYSACYDFWFPVKHMRVVMSKAKRLEFNYLRHIYTSGC